MVSPCTCYAWVNDESTVKSGMTRLHGSSKLTGSNGNFHHSKKSRFPCLKLIGRFTLVTASALTPNSFLPVVTDPQLAPLQGSHEPKRREVQSFSISEIDCPTMSLKININQCTGSIKAFRHDQFPKNSQHWRALTQCFCASQLHSAYSSTG